MHIDKYKTDNGYVDENNCYYEDAESFLQSKVLGFCGCGDSEASLKHTQLALRQVSKIKELVWEDKMSYDDWRVESIKFLGNENSMYFMWYWLDSKSLTEHGGSVPGWLTENGKELLEDLNDYFKES